MREGYIALHRKTINWEWFQRGHNFKVFAYLLMMAQHKDIRYQGIVIKKGQLLTSNKRIAKDTGVPIQQIKTILTQLKLTHELTRSTTAQWSIITIVHWMDYQGQPTNQPATNPLLTSCKNVNNVNNKTSSAVEKNSTKHNEIIDHLNKTNNSSYKYKSRKTVSLLNALLKEYSESDIKKVISYKSSEWANTEFEKFLRPVTLFGNKFEDYYQQSLIETKETKILKLFKEVED